ncbi:MAG: UDP-2,3-diacylglucosamine diphosphatase LpxI [Akkermansiaceae bacterium]|nr:UDP-2,3-diacylglucosamine diphosphatase LpxI [Akkermansiaceae bacterium]
MRSTFGIVAGNGAYPATLIRAARRQAPQTKIVGIGFRGETRDEVANLCDEFEWFHVGQLVKPLQFMLRHGVSEAVMVGQIDPSNLFNLRPDLRALVLLAKLNRRNAETIFGMVADEAERKGIHVLPATTYMEEFLPSSGPIAGPQPNARQMEDARYGIAIAKEISRLDIGQSVIVRHGTVLAVEGYEGTNACIRRGGELGHSKHVTLAKVAKPNHDMRFDVPCVGASTIETCISAGIEQIAVEACRTLLLEEEQVRELCRKHKIALHAL